MNLQLKSLTLLALMLMLSASFTACKKGDNDPGLSLKSRSGRLTGKWSLTKGLNKVSYDGEIKTYTYDNGKYTITDGSPNLVTGTYTYDINFEKNGAFSLDFTEIINGNLYSTTIKGLWSWMGKNKNQDLKAKETLLLTETSYVSSFSGSSYTTTWQNPVLREAWILDKLSDKEMVVKFKSSVNDDGDTVSLDVSFTFTKK